MTPELLPTMAVDFRTADAQTRTQQIKDLESQGWILLQYVGLGKIALFMQESEAATAERVERQERLRQASVAGMHPSSVRKTERIAKGAGYAG